MRWPILCRNVTDYPYRETFTPGSHYLAVYRVRHIIDLTCFTQYFGCWPLASIWGARSLVLERDYSHTFPSASVWLKRKSEARVWEECAPSVESEGGKVHILLCILHILVDLIPAGRTKWTTAALAPRSSQGEAHLGNAWQDCSCFNFR